MYILVKLVQGKFREVHPLMWVVAIAFLVYFMHNLAEQHHHLTARICKFDQEAPDPSGNGASLVSTARYPSFAMPTLRGRGVASSKEARGFAP